MKAYYQDPSVTIYSSDCRRILSQLLAESIQCVITSPPYWGLRKYGGVQNLVWGDGDCHHNWDTYKRPPGGGHPAASAKVGATKADVQRIYDGIGAFCSLCGAWKGQYGLEPTPEMYIQHSIEILREIKRVLRKDGVVFWNIGDSYASGKGTCFNPGGGDHSLEGHKLLKDARAYPLDRGNKSALEAVGLKPKDLCLIPARLQIAVQQDGWHIFSIIIWSKPNPMPESTTRRPTTSHEYILVLAKSDKHYWDADAVREPSHPDTWGLRKDGSYGGQAIKDYQSAGAQDPSAVKSRIATSMSSLGRNIRTVWEFATEPFGMEMCLECKIVYEASQYRRLPDRAGSRKCQCADKVKDYIPSWIPATIEDEIEVMGELIPITEEGWQCEVCGEIYRPEEWQKLPEARIKICRCGESNWLSHFAVFPRELPRRCIMAATPPKCCAECGAPWERITQRPDMRGRPLRGTAKQDGQRIHTGWDGYPQSAGQKWQQWRNLNPNETLGWQPTCTCDTGTKPAIVLDPMAGTGTVGEVAKSLGREGILIELSEDYCKLAQKRVESLPLPLPIEI